MALAVNIIMIIAFSLTTINGSIDLKQRIKDIKSKHPVVIEQKEIKNVEVKK